MGCVVMTEWLWLRCHNSVSAVTLCTYCKKLIIRISHSTRESKTIGGGASEQLWRGVRVRTGWWYFWVSHTPTTTTLSASVSSPASFLTKHSVPNFPLRKILNGAQLLTIDKTRLIVTQVHVKVINSKHSASIERYK